MKTNSIKKTENHIDYDLRRDYNFKGNSVSYRILLKASHFEKVQKFKNEDIKTQFDQVLGLAKNSTLNLVGMGALECFRKENYGETFTERYLQLLSAGYQQPSFEDAVEAMIRCLVNDIGFTRSKALDALYMMSTECGFLVLKVADYLERIYFSEN